MPARNTGPSAGGSPGLAVQIAASARAERDEATRALTAFGRQMEDLFARYAAEQDHLRAGATEAHPGPRRMVGVTRVAEWVGTEPQTVSAWFTRYKGTAYEPPVPDAVAEPGRGGEGTVDRLWDPSRKQEWIEYAKSGRPGRGGRIRPRAGDTEVTK